MSSEQETSKVKAENALLNIKRTLHGSIDLIEAGIAYGWAYDPSNIEPLNINLIADGRLVGAGLANGYREDLLNANIGKGNHAFKIDIEELPNNNKDVISYSIVEATTRQTIENGSYEYSSVSQNFCVDDFREENGYILFNVVSNKNLSNNIVCIYSFDEIISEIFLSDHKKYSKVEFKLPIHFHDGNDHLIKVSVKGMTQIIATLIVNIKPIKTPWTYLKDSFRTPRILSLSKQSSTRYESLNYQLEAMVNNKRYSDIQNILTYHTVVVEGYEGRTEFSKIILPKTAFPKVSIIIPAFNKFALTYHCIASIALAFNKTPYEVILADDCSTDLTSEAESIIENLIVSRTSVNLRFLKNCNEASKYAKGEYIIFLNNDTEVTSFWIDELINKHDEDQSIAITGSKLLNSDGTLQEAGGIIWGNGDPWNVGRNQNALLPEYNYSREVDYITGAALCIKKSVWEEVGLFSDEFSPCYYEDTDLSFKVRSFGYKVVYVPHSEVIHFEGLSHGKDISEGLKKYQAINASLFCEKWFSEYCDNGIPHHDLLPLKKDRHADQRILVIDYATPIQNQDAGSYAAIQEMKLMQSLGFKVTFVPANLAHLGAHTAHLQKMGIEVLYTPFYLSVNQVLERRLNEFNAVYITRYHIAKDYIDYIRKNSRAKIIFNNSDLHFLREMRLALKKKDNKELLDNSLKTREEELSVCQKVDAILCYNATEHAVITSHISESDKLHITPWVLEEKNKGKDFLERHGIAFLGGFNHLPNREAVEFLNDEIMPLLEKKRPDIILYVYGSKMPIEYKECTAENIRMVGFSESLDDVYHNHRVFVAPLLSGAGIKGKVLESMAYHLPTVLTNVAAEGTGLTHGISTLIAHSPEEWVDSIIKLYDDHVLWHKFSENSQLLVDMNYSFLHGKQVFKKIFSSVGIYSKK
ncbi:glycosyltransferase [Marinomonas algicola]|uniref:glycosyltransferase n=1 Tax=Marinomonas algicola TaxID=2773454 RepID=UPI0017486086|nr:glycosyltransferase [Marinomonas algicola]